MGWAVFDALRRALEAITRDPGELLQVPFRENDFSDKVGSLLRQHGYRAASRINLWEMASAELRERDPVKILKAMRHPLQPDVDLLIEDPQDSHRLSGFEIKVIRWHPSSIQKVVPRARLYTGFDQALSLTTYGLDYVCLWHVFVPSRAAYRKALRTKGYEWAEQFDDCLIETATAYSAIAPTILDNFQLPIGYIPTCVIIDLESAPLDQIGIADALGDIREPRLLRLEPTKTGTRVRNLLQKALDLQQTTPLHNYRKLRGS